MPNEWMKWAHFLIAHKAKWLALLLLFDLNRVFQMRRQPKPKNEWEKKKEKTKHTTTENTRNSIHIYSAMRFILFAHILCLVLSFCAWLVYRIEKHFLVIRFCMMLCVSFFSFNSFGFGFAFALLRYVRSFRFVSFALFVLGPVFSCIAEKLLRMCVVCFSFMIMKLAICSALCHSAAETGPNRVSVLCLWHNLDIHALAQPHSMCAEKEH